MYRYNSYNHRPGYGTEVNIHHNIYYIKIYSGNNENDITIRVINDLFDITVIYKNNDITVDVYRRSYLHHYWNFNNKYVTIDNFTISNGYNTIEIHSYYPKQISYSYAKNFKFEL